MMSGIYSCPNAVNIALQSFGVFKFTKFHAIFGVSYPFHLSHNPIRPWEDTKGVTQSGADLLSIFDSFLSLSAEALNLQVPVFPGTPVLTFDDGAVVEIADTTTKSTQREDSIYLISRQLLILFFPTKKRCQKAAALSQREPEGFRAAFPGSSKVHGGNIKEANLLITEFVTSSRQEA